jgi:hypothetical protein
MKLQNYIESVRLKRARVLLINTHRIGLQLSYLLPAACYVYVSFYALRGSGLKGCG